ncbi:hypothetical protein H4K36_20780 [Streptomyces sp. DHE7-1]|uniref:hypothetical protein n=1 Tax=Streptomyces sp. NPDC093248 TaxID=3155072 RepID=UPI0018EE7365|nr:hypothetical protein [Streptomyces sp. DHE7-1]
MRRTIATLATLGLTVAGLSLATATNASAAGYGCSGSQIDSYNTTANGDVWATAYLYYSSANGGTNCAVLVARKYAGVSHYMTVAINKSGSSTWKGNDGAFSSYAGPVTVTGTDGHCINLKFAEDNGGLWVGRDVNNVHCG